MPKVEPFKGLRYNTQRCAMNDVIAPPYDVVDEAERKVLAERSPYNAIHVELPVPSGSLDRYTHAASIFASWQQDSALQNDDVASLYIYRMSFPDETGAARATTGVIAALGVDVVGGTEVLPHEETMPKPKGDRLDLLRACEANLSPIWGLSPVSGLAEACVAATMSAPAPHSATDDEGVLHEAWPVSEPASIAAITSLVSSAPIVIADGHHRYETARHYQEEQRRAHNNTPGAYDAVMAFIVELSPDELFVRAIHRLVNGLPANFDILSALEPYFEITPGPADPVALGSALTERGALGLLQRGGTHFLVPRASLIQASERDLDSARLDVGSAALPDHELTYQHGVSNVAAAVSHGEAQIGFLLRPATVEQIAATARGGARMPPKTTFFQPKPRTGMVYRSVRA